MRQHLFRYALFRTALCRFAKFSVATAYHVRRTGWNPMFCFARTMRGRGNSLHSRAHRRTYMSYLLKLHVLPSAHGARFLILSLYSPTYDSIWPDSWNAMACPAYIARCFCNPFCSAHISPYISFLRQLLSLPLPHMCGFGHHIHPLSSYAHIWA